MLGKTKLDPGLAEAMRKYQKQQEKEEVVAAPLKPADPNLPFCILVDIDRTLAIRHVNRGIFEFEKADLDGPVVATQRLLQDLFFANNNDSGEKTDIIYMTGREEKFRAVTEEWLKKHGLGFDKLFMRGTGDRRPADIMKEDLYVYNIAHKYNVLFLLDDDPKVVDKFRSLGIYVLVADISRG